MGKSRCVFDTNVLVSALLFKESQPGRAFRFALTSQEILVSSATLHELDDVLARPKFERYVQKDERELFVTALLDRAELIEVTHKVEVCRDPRDDKILELALSGHASTIVTGDPDLLTLHPFQGIDIVSPNDFLESIAGTR